MDDKEYLDTIIKEGSEKANERAIKTLKEKYRIIRDQKIRERVEALGVKIQGDEDRETLLQKEKEYIPGVEKGVDRKSVV